MKINKKNNRKACDIDALLHNTWLQAISLRHGPKFERGEGHKLWQHCVADVERVQQALKEAGMDAQSCQHILYAQCALLDEAIKRRGVEDEAYLEWYVSPLQGHFLGTLEAGDSLCDRMREVLRTGSAHSAVLACFSRVMLLGFLGGYSALDDPEREKLVQALSEQAPPFRYLPTAQALVAVKRRRSFKRLLFSWPGRISFYILLIALLWLGLNYWLTSVTTSFLEAQQ